jgi:hypothetical protein
MGSLLGQVHDARGAAGLALISVGFIFRCIACVRHAAAFRMEWNKAKII